MKALSWLPALERRSRTAGKRGKSSQSGFRLGGIVRFRDSLACSDVVDVGRFRTEDGMYAETHTDGLRMRAVRKC